MTAQRFRSWDAELVLRRNPKKPVCATSPAALKDSGSLTHAPRGRPLLEGGAKNPALNIAQFAAVYALRPNCCSDQMWARALIDRNPTTLYAARDVSKRIHSHGTGAIPSR